MNRLTLTAVIVLSTTGATELQAPPRPTIVVSDTAGREVLGLGPQDQPVPDPESAPPRVITEVDQERARMPDGTVVVGMSFLAWQENPGYRVVALAMVPAGARPTGRIAVSPDLARRQIATFSGSSRSPKADGFRERSTTRGRRRTLQRWPI